MTMALEKGPHEDTETHMHIREKSMYRWRQRLE
jgi:hypothetical protein